jgi:inorganic triphosphatase YgiF
MRFEFFDRFCPSGRKDMTREIELKFIGTIEALDMLRRSKLFKTYNDGRVKTKQLKSIYFDTPDSGLAQRGVSLRIRKDGTKLTQTIKSMNGKSAPRWDRAEQDAPVSGLRPDPELVADSHVRKTLSEWQDRDELHARFETDFRRTAMPLRAGSARIEAAFDVGEVKALGARAGVNAKVAELELELKDGPAQELFDLARQVARSTTLRFAIETKADRGYALTLGTPDKPVRAKPLELEPDMPSGDAFAMILAEGLRQIIANENAILRARDAEGVHQMRVAIRRLRSAISAFGGAYDHGEIARIKGELAWLAKTLGLARDWDVFLERSVKPVQIAFPGDAGLDELTAATRNARRAAWESVLEALESERYRVLMVDIAAAVSGAAWIDPAREAAADAAGKTSPYGRDIAKTARKSLHKRLHRVRRLGERIEDLTVPKRHEMRIALKRLRYASDFLQSCFERKSASRYLAALSRLQDVFGELNDAAMAEHMVGHLVADGPAAPDLARAGGVVTGWHMALSVKLWADARKRWRRFASVKPFWR